MRVEQEQLRILVIEYDTWRRTAVADRLRGAGYHVRQASNGFSGLRLARHSAPDIVVLGTQLPDLSVTELRQELWDQPDTRAVALVSILTNPCEPSGSIEAEVQAVLAQRPSAVRHW